MHGDYTPFFIYEICFFCCLLCSRPTPIGCAAQHASQQWTADWTLRNTASAAATDVGMLLSRLKHEDITTYDVLA